MCALVALKTLSPFVWTRATGDWNILYTFKTTVEHFQEQLGK